MYSTVIDSAQQTFTEGSLQLIKITVTPKITAKLKPFKINTRICFLYSFLFQQILKGFTKLTQFSKKESNLEQLNATFWQVVKDGVSSEVNLQCAQ